MITLTHTIAGEECRIYFPERRQDLIGFDAFLSQGDKVLGFDTETTGLDIFSPGYKCRLAQFGNQREAWVLRTDLFGDVIEKALRQSRAFVAHNAPFDLLVTDKHLGVSIEELGSRVFDTRIFAHLLDPRTKAEGGAGLHLKELCEIYVDDQAPDTQEGLSAIFLSLFNAWKKTVPAEVVDAFKSKSGKRPHLPYGFANIEIDHETYVRYAGLDVILVTRLFYELAPLVKELGLNDLSKFEHHLQCLLAIMQRKGMKLDVPYIERLREELLKEQEEYSAIAARYGVPNINSTDQVAAALVGMGETLTEKTGSGKDKVDKEVLMPLADLDREWERIEARTPNPLADAVLRAKRAKKWGEDYAGAFLNLKDGEDRLHAMIGGLQARTARMSISRPPLQQLPSGDWKIRRAVIADPGQLIIASDYSQVEMRVLAALCQDPTLVEAIKSGVDLHDFTAEKVFGPDFTKMQRKISKSIGFGKVYGGGATTVARQTGADIDAIRPAMAAYDSTFPGIKRYGQRLQKRAEYGKKEVITVSGRHLPLDKDRLYAATNYVVQSTARDLLAQAIVDIFDAGLGDHLLLPVHDELVGQAPKHEAEEVIQEIGRIMGSTFYGIPITSDPEVYGPSWGSGYKCPPHLDAAA
ncbi:3'-5' exonuclease family protein [Pseudarthrobacter siccitolerans]|uniref:DNA polymerase I n=1 Tax=Pseudarthrobacter siccitolerans TaxID=861266 RepID=A0A024GXZ2_9MICC|nr:DNA polymerase [Pseudarthrobacter siccitolerans]CCQ44638.1 3'-5' exonuclease family protein [Pseudarthrobacter siccitolerans]